jgi:hypothetical protein
MSYDDIKSVLMSYDCVENHKLRPRPPKISDYVQSIVQSATVMHIEGNMFLITVTDPLNLMLQFKIENEGWMSLGIALQNQIAVLQSRAFEPRIVYTDPHSTFRSMTREFPGVEIDVGGKGDYVAKVDV